MTLTEFLEARIAEDEAVALESKGTGHGAWVEATGTFGDIRSEDGHAVMYGDSGDRADRDHILRWEPARVLAECEAKRRITVMCAGDDTGTIDWDEIGPFAVQVLRYLALPYADHPDYLPEWRV